MKNQDMEDSFETKRKKQRIKDLLKKWQTAVDATDSAFYNAQLVVDQLVDQGIGDHILNWKINAMLNPYLIEGALLVIQGFCTLSLPTYDCGFESCTGEEPEVPALDFWAKENAGVEKYLPTILIK